MLQKKVGFLVKDRPTGKNVDEWTKALEKSGKKYEEVDIGPALSACLAVKDEEEVVCITHYSAKDV